MSSNMLYLWDDPRLSVEQRLEAARLEIDTLWCDLHDIACYRGPWMTVEDINTVKQWAWDSIEKGMTRSDNPEEMALSRIHSLKSNQEYWREVDERVRKKNQPLDEQQKS